ncbi:hypothetical protein OK074_4054 [Actinobacteria bacterium OK074]|nr:hypothetical protein OK074_4054 [Actinobacteria bacterium OK074]
MSDVMTAGRVTRTVRAAVFAAVCVLLAALAHVVMSGSQVPGWTFAAGAVATGAVGWGLAGHERGMPLVVSVVVAVQMVLHEVFQLAQSAAGGGAGAGGGSGSGMGGAGGMDGMGHAVGGGPASLGMFFAHLLAAVLCGLWLAHGERAAFRVLRAVGTRLTAPLRLLLALPAPPHRPRLRVRRARSDRAPRRLLLAHAITSRGPPLGAAAA